jgi:hypothetical protein
MTSQPLFKTTIVIWSEWDPTLATTIADLAREAEDGDAYCSAMKSVRVADPTQDPDWDCTDFFDSADDSQLSRPVMGDRDDAARRASAYGKKSP